MTNADEILILSVAVVVLVFILSFNRKIMGETLVSVSVNGDIVKVLDLKINGTSEVVTGSNRVKIEVKNGRAGIIESSCKNQICRHAGWIKNAGEAVICVPNKLVLEIKAVKEKNIDAVCR